MVWFMEGMCFLPTFLVVWSSSTFIVSYIIAVSRRDVDVIFPYIRMLCIAAFSTMYTEYKFVEGVLQKTGANYSKCNKASFVLGIISCLGMCLVATFQVTTITIVHDVGAFVFFISGVVYAIIQTVIGFRIRPYGSTEYMCLLRVVFTAVAAIAVVPTIVCALLSGNKPSLHWDSSDKGYTLHITSAVCEWVTAFSFVFFFLTYIQEFRHFKLDLSVHLSEYPRLLQPE
ncbi:hypothetical protein DNTS_000497 [Danionella cerebrum]|uniref:CWH43-like N-terminal domain-containing protein n=1 Tax=Danionella cerebrum TaxID=2873325 RepID=A0A553RNV5_9TELE|nr:hypothetical protein DNTS_000497 [Danionella translucida]